MSQPSVLQVRTLEAAKVLLDPRQRRFLAPFVGRELSIKEVALELEVKANSLLYQVHRMLRFGLLVEVAGVSQGRPVKRYRASADRFLTFFDLEEMTEFMPEDILHWSYDVQYLRFIEAMAQTFIHSANHAHGYVVYRNAEGQVVGGYSNDGLEIKGNLREDRPCVSSIWKRLELDAQEAKAFQRELELLVRRYEAKHGANIYLVHLGIAPAVPSSSV